MDEVKSIESHRHEYLGQTKKNTEPDVPPPSLLLEILPELN